jgi:sporulation protein YlmC with PRC-barrel domain
MIHMKFTLVTAACAALLALPALAQETTSPNARTPSAADQRGGMAPTTDAGTATAQISADDLLDEKVLNDANESIGEVEDVLIDNTGKVAAVIVGAGGFLGLGEKSVALAFDKLKFARDDDNELVVKTDMRKEDLEAAPTYTKPGKRS